MPRHGRDDAHTDLDPLGATERQHRAGDSPGEEEVFGQPQLIEAGLFCGDRGGRQAFRCYRAAEHQAEGPAVAHGSPLRPVGF